MPYSAPTFSSDGIEEMPVEMQMALLRLAARDLVSLERLSSMPNPETTERADEEDQQPGRACVAA